MSFLLDKASQQKGVSQFLINRFLILQTLFANTISSARVNCTVALSIHLPFHDCFTDINCWFHGSSFKGFSIVFLLIDWLKLNHLKSRMECGFSDIFSRHFCSTVAETIGLTNHAANFGAKKMFRKPHLKLLR